MDKHLSTRYDEELRNLQNMVMEMARLCETQLHTLSTYLRKEGTVQSLHEIEGIDERVNQYHININQECIHLIAKRSPVASDLRDISSNDRMATDLERIGDECCKIARMLTQKEVNPRSGVWKEIHPTIRLAKNMLTRTIDMIARHDDEAAFELIKDDIELDATHSSAIRQVVSYMFEDPANITAGIDVLLAAKALERIGDHCINIAEAIIFATQGKDVRHGMKNA